MPDIELSLGRWRTIYGARRENCEIMFYILAFDLILISNAFSLRRIQSVEVGRIKGHSQYLYAISRNRNLLSKDLDVRLFVELLPRVSQVILDSGQCSRALRA